MPKRPLRHFIKEGRQKLGLSQAELAERMDTTEATVSRKENSKRGLSLEDLNWFAAGLSIDPFDLLRHPDQPSPEALLRAVDEPTKEVVLRMLRGVSTLVTP